MLYDISNKMILNLLNSKVYGHDDAKKSLIALVNRSKLRHYQKWGQLMSKEYLIKPSKCLLIGGSGTGKTYLVQSLADMCNFPLLVVDATKFNPTGASGGIKSDSLKTMIVTKAQEYLEDRGDTYFSIEGVIDQMVVFVDEFDKLSSHYDGSSGGSWNTHTQTHFLTLFENYEDFSGVSWIFAGAFSGMGKENRARKNTIGFCAVPDESVKLDEVSDEDIVNYGMLPEIVGRLTSICRLDKLTEDDFYSILVKIVIPKKLQELLYFNITDINLTEQQLRDISKSASKSSQGVRYLSRYLDKHFLDLEFNYEQNIKTIT